MAKSIPITNQRYQDIATGRGFEVLAVDDYTAQVDLYFDDGDFDQINFDDWSKMVVVPVSSLNRLAPMPPFGIDDWPPENGEFPAQVTHKTDYMFGWDEF